MIFRILILIISAFIFLRCSGNEYDNLKEKKSSTKNKDLFEGEKAFSNEINSIEKDKKITEVTSLNYINREGKSFSVKGFVDSEMNLRKLTYNRIFDNGDESKLSFYYIGNRKFATRNEYSHSNETSFKTKITESFYDDSSKVFFSKCSSIDHNSNKSNKFKKCNPISHNDNFALKIINQQGEFQTNFQGFTENMGRIYLLVGTENYTSALAISKLDGIIKLLKSNENKFLGKKLKVDFTINTEANGFTFQAIKSVQLTQ